MRRVALALFSTVTGLVILLDFKTHGPTAGTTSVAAGTPGTDATGSAASSPASSAASTPSSGAKTITGDSVDTRWGPVQVQITVTDGKVTKADAVVYPSGNSRDQQINAYAVPALNQEAVSAGSAKIDAISGATVTSDGYIGSLQSAIDKAGL